LKSTDYLILVLSFLAVIMVAASNLQPAKVVVSSQAEPMQAADIDWWPMFGHDLAHTSYSTSMTNDTNQILWNVTIPDFVTYGSPAVVDGKVYVNTGGLGMLQNYVYALDALTGANIWTHNMTVGDDGACSTPAVAYGNVYVSTQTQLFALSATTGVPIWAFSNSGETSSPAVADGAVYVQGSADGISCYIYALNATSGSSIWNYTLGGGPSSNYYDSPAVADGKVYAGSYNTGKVYALNVSTGALIWSYQTGSSVYSSPAAADGRVYIGSADHAIYALNATTGTQIWNYTTGNWIGFSSPAVAYGNVYIGSADYTVYALDATTGAKIWEYYTGANPDDSTPAVADGKVYIAASSLFALNATTGQLIWDYGTSGYSPAVADGRVYFGTFNYYDRQIYAFGPESPVSVSPSSAVMDVGQSKLFTSAVTGGTGPYSYQWYLDDSSVSGATSTAWTYTPSAAGSHTVYVIMTDSATIPVAAQSNTANVTVNAMPSVTIAPTSLILDVGQSKLFTSNVTAGTSPYLYQWYLDGSPVPSATGATWTFTPASAGSYTVYLNATDSVGASTASNTALATVNGALSATISPTSISTNVSQPQHFNSSVTGGTSPYTYQWYLNGSSVTGATSENWTFTPTSTGYYTVYLNVTDSVGMIAISPASDVTVAIPEFQTIFFLPFFIMTTLLFAIFLTKKKHLDSKEDFRKVV
jgi:outer membrane protein assembly factor BamB